MTIKTYTGEQVIKLLEIAKEDCKANIELRSFVASEDLNTYIKSEVAIAEVEGVIKYLIENLD